MSNDIESILKTVLGNKRAAHLATLKIAQLKRFPEVSDFEKLIGPKHAEKVVAVMQMSRCDIVCEDRPMMSPEDVMPYLSWLKFEPQENFVVVSLNAHNDIVNRTVITKGLADMTLCHPREVFRQALKDNAVSIIVAHNHPSGCTEPSEQDILLTRNLCEAGKLMQIPVIDHLIVGRREFTSFCRMYPEIIEKGLVKKQNYNP